MIYLPNTNTLCLEGREYIGVIAPENTYRSQQQRGSIRVHGRGGNGNGVMIEYETLPDKYKTLVQAHYGNPYEYHARQPLLRLVQPDAKARSFYADYILPSGRPLPSDYQQRYTRQAEWLNMILAVLGDKRALKQELKISIEQFWENVIALHTNDKPINPELPASYRRLRERVDCFKIDGYKGLIETGRFCNSNARKVTADIQGLLCSLYLQRHGRATLLQVAQDYNKFMAGEITPVDITTGEAFRPEDFLVKGNVQQLAPATVRYYLNKKETRELVDSFKLSGHDYTQKHIPHNRRIGPKYSFSMVSMDDYLPPFKTPDGKRTVWMYVVFDVASTAIVGVSYGTRKGVELVNEALRDMMRLVERNGWGIPMEIEIERSLNWARRGSDEAPDLFTEGNVFPYVRFAKANNSQEKAAERFLGSFKYEELIKKAGFLGRPHARNENYRLNRDIDETRYYTKSLIKLLQECVDAYNNAPHSQNSGLTRWEYLEQNINPDAVKNNPATIMPYIGLHSKTSIRRGDVEVQGEYYAAPTNINVMSAGGKAKVDAYWIPGIHGEAPAQVYLYQDGQYVGVAAQIERYQKARAERTDKDWEVMGRQAGRQKSFENMIAEKRQTIKIIDTVDNEDEGIIRAGVSYDKEAWEEEDEAMLVPVVKGVNADSADENHLLSAPKMPICSPKQGGYMQKLPVLDDDFFSPEAIKSRAQQRL